MDKFLIDTSFDFPFFKYIELVSYTEVKKPSGLSYMMLVILNESVDKNVNLSQALVNFNVPRTLHYIFAETILNLIDQDILEMSNKSVFQKNKFNDYLIKDIVFTNKGKKVFSEEAIPSNKTKETKVPIFYNIALNEFSYSIDELESRPLMNNAIKDDYMKDLSCKKSVEDFLNKTKGTKFALDKINYQLIKKEEVIVKVEELSKENWVGKYDCRIELNGDNVHFNFENHAISVFFSNFYNSQMINEAIGFKDKFTHKLPFSKNLKLNNYKNKEFEVLIPKDISKILNTKYLLFITKGNYFCETSEINVSNESIFDKYFKECEFVTFDKGDGIFAYVPGEFIFDYRNKDKINISLIVKIKMTIEEARTILNAYMLNYLKDYSIENYNKVLRMCELIRDYSSASSLLENYLTKNAENNIVILSEIKTLSLSYSQISKKYKELLDANYKKYFENLREGNLETFLKITDEIPEILNLKESDVLNKIKNVLNIKNKNQYIYVTLVKHGFTKELVCLYFNPVEEALKNGSSNDSNLISLISFNNRLNELKTITNIFDLKNYVFDEEIIDKQSFKNVFLTASSLIKQIQFFKEQNKELFIEYDNFMNLFSTINDDFNMQEELLKNKKAFSESIIEDMIKKGEYQKVFVNLCVKLESILKNKFNLDGKLSKMLQFARQNKIIKDSIISDLHKFRINRNAYIHELGNSTKFSAKDLRRWSSIIFELDKEETN